MTAGGRGPGIGVGRTLVRNTAWNYAGFAVNLASNLIVFPVVIRELGDAVAGIWLLLGSVTGYMGLLHLGVVPALTRFVAVQLAEGDYRAVNRRASTALALVLAAGSVALLAVPAAPWLSALLKVPDSLTGTVATALRLGAIGFFLQLPGHVFNALLNGAERQDRCSQVWIVSNGLKGAGNVGLLWAGGGLLALLWFDLVLITVCGALLSLLARRAIPTLRIRPSLVGLREARELTSFGGLLFVSNLSRLAIEQTDRIVIGLFLTISMVTYYSAGWKVYMLVYAIPTTLLAAVGPTAGAMYGRGDVAGLRRLFLRTTKYSAGVGWPVLLSAAGCASLFLDVWAGPGFGDHAPVVHLLLLSFAVTMHNHAGHAIVLAMRRIGPLVLRWDVPQALLNLTLSILLVQSLGIVGVALGTVAPALTLEYFFLSYVLAQLGVSWREFWREAVAPSLWPAVGSFLPLGITYWSAGPDALLLVPVAAFCSVAYAGCFWLVSLGQAEREQLKGHLPGRQSQAMGSA